MFASDTPPLAPPPHLGLLPKDGARCALVVIDIQERLLPHIAGHESALTHAVQAVALARRLGIPILALEQYRKGLGDTVPALREALAQADAPPPIEKRAFSPFGEPGFPKALHALTPAPQHLILCGIETHVCVLQTALDARAQGLGTYLIADATGSRDPAHAALAQQRMRDAGTRIGAIEMLAFALLRTAAHPAFQDIRRIIL